LRKLHPATIVVALLPRLKEAVQMAIPVIIGSCAAGHEKNQDWIALLIGGLTGVMAVGAYWTTRFDVQSNHIVHTTGWIFRKDRRIPLEQIQNVNLRQNLLERLFHVATVDVETAMGRGRDLKLSVLSWSEAERLKEELLGAAHLDLATDPKPERAVVRLDRQDLILGAVTENHFVQMTVVMFTVGGPILGAVGSYADKLPLALSMAIFGIGLATLTVGSWLWGVATYILKYGGFAVDRTESVFRISYGLLNKVQMAIRPGRIEFLKITKTIPQRWMQRASFFVGTASSFGEAGVFAPVALFVPEPVAYAGVSEVIPGLNMAALPWQPFHPIFYWSRMTRGVIWASIVCLAAYEIDGLIDSPALAWIGAGIVVAVIFVRLATLLLAKPENAFAITEDALVVRAGYIHQSISAMPIDRVENVAVTQPMWWKGTHAATLAVQAMKNRIFIGAIPESAIETLMAFWRKKIEASAVRPLDQKPNGGAEPDPISQEREIESAAGT
jgi:putative membrane protein